MILILIHSCYDFFKLFPWTVANNFFPPFILVFRHIQLSPDAFVYSRIFFFFVGSFSLFLYDFSWSKVPSRSDILWFWGASWWKLCFKVWACQVQKECKVEETRRTTRAVTAAAALRNRQKSLKRQRVWAPPYLWGHKSRSQPAFQEHIKIFSSPRTFSMCFCSWSF